jgi:hypothetical protein
MDAGPPLHQHPSQHWQDPSSWRQQQAQGKDIAWDDGKKAVVHGLPVHSTHAAPMANLSLIHLSCPWLPHASYPCCLLVKIIMMNCRALVLGRLVMGIGIGVCTSAVPTFLGEIAPAAQRGAVVEVGCEMGGVQRGAVTTRGSQMHSWPCSCLAPVHQQLCGCVRVVSASKSSAFCTHSIKQP